MNMYKICLRVKTEIYFKSDTPHENPKYVWIVSTNLLNVVTYLEKILKTEHADYYFESIQLMGEARIGS